MFIYSLFYFILFCILFPLQLWLQVLLSVGVSVEFLFLLFSALTPHQKIPACLQIQIENLIVIPMIWWIVPRQSQSNPSWPATKPTSYRRQRQANRAGLT